MGNVEVLISELFLLKRGADKVWGNLPPYFRDAYGSPTNLKSALAYAIRNTRVVLTDATVTQVAEYVVYNKVAAPEVVQGTTPADATTTLATSITATDARSPYDMLLGYCPYGTEERVPPHGTEKKVKYRRVEDPTDPNFDLLQFEVRILSAASVATLKRAAEGRLYSYAIDREASPPPRAPTRQHSLREMSAASVATVSGGNYERFFALAQSLTGAPPSAPPPFNTEHHIRYLILFKLMENKKDAGLSIDELKAVIPAWAIPTTVTEVTKAAAAQIFLNLVAGPAQAPPS